MMIAAEHLLCAGYLDDASAQLYLLCAWPGLLQAQETTGLTGEGFVSVNLTFWQGRKEQTCEQVMPYFREHRRSEESKLGWGWGGTGDAAVVSWHQWRTLSEGHQLGRCLGSVCAHGSCQGPVAGVGLARVSSYRAAFGVEQSERGRGRWVLRLQREGLAVHGGSRR